MSALLLGAKIGPSPWVLIPSYPLLWGIKQYGVSTRMGYKRRGGDEYGVIDSGVLDATSDEGVCCNCYFLLLISVFATTRSELYIPLKRGQREAYYIFPY